MAEWSLWHSIRFSTLLIQLPHGLCTTFPCLSCDPSCDIVTSCHMIMTMWHLWCNTFPHSLLCSKSKIKEKEKKYKININNDFSCFAKSWHSYVKVTCHDDSIIQVDNVLTKELKSGLVAIRVDIDNEVDILIIVER